MFWLKFVSTAMHLDCLCLLNLGVKFVIYSLLCVQVHVKQNQSIKHALKKAMTMRDLSTTQCVPYVIQSNKPRLMVDWSTNTSLLGGQEVSKVLHLCCESGRTHTQPYRPSVQVKQYDILYKN